MRGDDRRGENPARSIGFMLCGLSSMSGGNSLAEDVMKNVRLQFDITEDRSKDLDRLISECGLSTKKELFNYALTLLEWAVDETKEGHDIASVDRGNNKLHTLKMPIFSSVSKRPVL